MPNEAAAAVNTGFEPFLQGRCPVPPVLLVQENAGSCDRGAEAPQIFRPRNLSATELRCYGSQHLDVEQKEPGAPQPVYQEKQGHFGCIAHSVEHGFACEKSAQQTMTA